MKVRTLITSIFGVFIPPRKKRDGRDRHLTLRFVLVGTVPAKKNNQIAIVRHDEAERVLNSMLQASADGRITQAQAWEVLRSTSAMIVPSNRFQEWHKLKKQALDIQMATYLPLLQARGLIFPLSNVSMVIYHHWKDRIKRDLSNRLQSIEDLFVDARIISDDNDFVLGPISTDAGRYKGEILDHITVIHLTVYY